MWDPDAFDGDNEPIRVLEKGFRKSSDYEVSITYQLFHFVKKYNQIWAVNLIFFIIQA
jgi:hypothetical protein